MLAGFPWLPEEQQAAFEAAAPRPEQSAPEGMPETATLAVARQDAALPSTSSHAEGLGSQLGSDRGSQEGVGTSQPAGYASRQTERSADKDKLTGVVGLGVSDMYSTSTCTRMHAQQLLRWLLALQCSFP